MILKQKIIIGVVAALATVGTATGVVVANVNGSPPPNRPSLSLDGTSQSADLTTTTVGSWENPDTIEDTSTEATEVSTQPPHEHSFPEAWTAVKEPDCVNAGYRVYTCACGAEERESIPAIGHRGTDNIYEISAEQHISKCVVCEEIIAAEDHIHIEDIGVEGAFVGGATCTTAATYYKSCQICHALSSEVFTSGVANGHSPVIDPAIGATCKDNGLTEGSHCSVCRTVLTAQQEIPVLQEHIPDEETGLCACCADCSVGLRYQLNDDETGYTLSGIGSCEDTILVIPEYFQGKPVTGIGDFAFNGCTSLTTVTIPSGVTNIGSYAFSWCSGLTGIKFNGTREQWEAVEKASGWDFAIGSYTVHCTDGNVAK